MVETLCELWWFLVFVYAYRYCFIPYCYIHLFIFIIWTQWDSVSWHIIWWHWLPCFSFTPPTNLSPWINTWNGATLIGILCLFLCVYPCPLFPYSYYLPVLVCIFGCVFGTDRSGDMKDKVRSKRGVLSVFLVDCEEWRVVMEIHIVWIWLNNRRRVAWKQQRERDLQEFPLWKRTYDYTVQLLARSLVTIFDQIKYVFGITQMTDVEEDIDSRIMNFDYINRSQSVSGLMLSSVYPSENSKAKFTSSPLSWD